MKSRWYRKPIIKGILILMVHLSLIVVALGSAFLLRMGNMVADFGKKSYVETSAYGSELYTDALNILRALDGQKYLELNNENGKMNVMNLRTNKIGTVREKAASQGELLYSLENLKSWGEDGINWEYGTYGSDANSILVFRTDEGTYHYYYAGEFLKRIEDEKIELTLETDGNYQYPQEVLDYMENEIRENSYFSFYDLGISEIRDAEEGLSYIEGWFYDSGVITETYTPVGADSILSIINESEYWNGKLSGAYDALQNAIYEVQEASSGDAILRMFREGNTNMTYVYVLPSQKKVYTNCTEYENFADYKKTLKKLKESSSHIIIYPQLSKSSSTFDASLQDWQSLVNSYLPSADEEEYIFAVSVDTEFPIADTLAENNKNYQSNAGKIIPVFVIVILSVLVFLFCIVWLTVTAGRKSQDEEIHLYALDHLFTEISAAAVFLLWVSGVSIVVMASDSYGYSSSIDKMILVAALVILALYTAAMFLTGYLSLVRRIKGKTLYKDSLLKWLIQIVKKCWRALKRLLSETLPNFMEDIMKNARSEVRFILEFGGFLILQFFLVVLGIASGSGVFVFLLFLIDLAAVYVFSRRAIGRQMIIDGLKKITDGELEYKIPVQKLKGEQKRVAEYINRIGEGLDAAVENSLRNERMKTELITNVSHDIKTPLTSIINYIELLKRENFTDEKVRGYLKILDQKAQRLKTLTEDVVEASKASTGNISLEKMNLDMAEMVKQADGEFAEAFQNKCLQPVVGLPKDPVVIHVDGRRLWRVFANIYLNVSKYAMEGTRVYEDLTVKNGRAVFSIKNISAEPLNISPDELTERFIRGDGARTTEGSGLGLSIAKSLTELQGGSFTLMLDGDLFKVTISFPIVS